MNRWPALLAALCIMGCEDTYVREHIIDNFVCVYMPWWMGECDGDEVTAKVMGVLDHGIVAADVTCECDMRNDDDTTTQHFGPYRMQRLVDGSCFVSWGVGGVPYFRARYDECSLESYPFSIADGDFRYLYGPLTGNHYRAPASTCCTGFNLEAFGVEE